MSEAIQVHQSNASSNVIFPNFVFDFSVVKYPFASCKRQGVGGIVELAPGYLPAVYGSIKKAGGLCIADEVQSGFARTGSHFWGFEIQGVVPDIVTVAKVNLFSVPFNRNQKTLKVFFYLDSTILISFLCTTRSSNRFTIFTKS